MTKTLNTKSPSTRLARLRCSPRESDDTTVSRAVTEVRPSLSSTRFVFDSPPHDYLGAFPDMIDRGRKPPRRSCSDSSALRAKPRHNWRSSAASTSSWAETRRRRVPRWSSERVPFSLNLDFVLMGVFSGGKETPRDGISGRFFQWLDGRR